MILSNEEKEDQIDLYALELSQIFKVEFDDSSSPLHNIVQHQSNIARDCFLICNLSIKSLTFTLWSLLNDKERHIKGESEKTDRAFELVDNILDLMPVKKNHIKDVFGCVLTLVYGIEGMINSFIPIENQRICRIQNNLIFTFLFPSEKERLFSDWLQSLLNLLPPNHSYVFASTFKRIVNEVQLTDSDREASKAIIKRLIEDSRK